MDKKAAENPAAAVKDGALLPGVGGVPVLPVGDGVVGVDDGGVEIDGGVAEVDGGVDGGVAEVDGGVAVELPVTLMASRWPNKQLLGEVHM